MNKEEFLKNLGQLVRSQTYQCYKGKPVKIDMRNQKRNVKAIAKGLGITLFDKEMLDLFLEMNAQDIDKFFVCETLKLKYLH